MKIEVGNNIQWESAAGKLAGNVKAILLNLNGKGETIPWLDVQDVYGYDDGKIHSNLRLCGNNDYLKMMKVRVL